MQVNLVTLINIQNKKQIQYSKVAQKNCIFSGVRNFRLQTDTISFCAHDICAPKNFQVTTLPNLYCPVCGEIMLKNEDVERFSGVLATKKGQALIDALDGLDNVQNFGIGTKRSSAYRPHRKLVVEQYKVLAKEHPTKDLYELTEVYYDVCIEKLRKAQLEIVKELREFVSSNISFGEQERIGAVISDYEKRIKGISDKPYYRKSFINEIVSAVGDEHKEPVRKVAEKMPSSQNDVNSFFVKHYKKAKNSQDIAKRLINDSVVSVEHIIPVNNKGQNRLSNYLCDCAYCNYTRGPKSFDEWIKELPEEFESRLQEYLQIVQDNVDNGKLDTIYDGYIKDVIATIEEASDGKIKLAQPETSIAAKKEKNLFEREKQIESAARQNLNISRIIHALSQEIAKLEAYEYYTEAIAEGRDEALETRRKQIVAQIIKFAPVAKQIELFNSKRQEYEKNQQTATKYTINIENLEREIEELKTANKQISPSGEFSEEELKSWVRYLHCEHLLTIHQKTLKAQDYKKLGISASDAREIFDYTRNALISEIAVLKENRVVKYNLNLKVLEEKQTSLNAIKESLKEIQGKIDAYKALEAEILQKCNGKTISEAMQEYNALQEELTTIEAIKGIADKRKKINSAKKKYTVNDEVLEQLRNSNGMNNLEFNSLFKKLQFYVD